MFYAQANRLKTRIRIAPTASARLSPPKVYQMKHSHIMSVPTAERRRWAFALLVRLFVEYPLYKKALDMQKRIEYNIKV